MRRIVVVGNSGSGKTTLADALAGTLGLARVELDALNHGPNWTPATPAALHAAVVDSLDRADDMADGWVVCGNYGVVREVVWGRADTVIWLDYPRRIVMVRVIRRSLTRVLRGTELWNGNRESWAALLALHDPQRSIIRWSWDGVTGYRRTLEPLWGRHDLGPGRWLHFTHPRELQRWARVALPLATTNSGGQSR